MTPSQRPTLQLDLKDLTTRPSTPQFGRVGLVALSVMALVSTVISVNSPSASSITPAMPAATNHTTVGEAAIQQGSRESTAQSTLSSPTVSPPMPARGVAAHQVSRKSAFRPAPVQVTDKVTGMMTKSATVLHAQPVGSGERTADPVTASGLPAYPAGSAADHSSTESDSLAVYPENGKMPRDLKIQLASLAPVPTSYRSRPAAGARSIGTAGSETLSRNRRASTLSIADTAKKGTDEPASADPAPLKLASIRPAPLDLGDPISPVLPTLTVPEIPEVPVNPLESALVEGDWIVEKVRKKDTISQIFDRVGISIHEAYALVETDQAEALGSIRPGDELEIVRLPGENADDRGRLGKLKFQLDQFNTLLVLREEAGFVAHILERQPEIRYRTAQATIWDSLLGSAREAGIPYDVVYSLATVLGWQVDFAKDIHGGDRFAVIYEELYLDGKRVGEGEVVAAELITSDRTIRAIRHVDEEGHVTYYAPDGDGIQGSFLRNPIRFARVTSGFSKRRLHPILKKWKAHHGVDYGAPMKTPVRATGDGLVHFAGNRKGYGRTIILRHGEKYETLYAHLNHFRKGLKSGSRVKQGEVIGYVGRTGWATGPHLHYEFRVSGKHMNPLTVELPSSAPIEPRYRDDFRRQASQWVAALEDAGRIPLAQNEN